MSNLKKYVLSQDWEIKSGSVLIETGSTVSITENRAEQLINSGIIEGKVKGAIKKKAIESEKESLMKPNK